MTRIADGCRIEYREDWAKMNERGESAVIRLTGGER